jgi:hypothetical protein
VSCNFSASTVILSPETCTKIHWFISMFLVRIVESLGQTGQTEAYSMWIPSTVIIFKMKLRVCTLT